MDRIQAMQVFLRVVETNSFARAAHTLGLPPSTVTSIIKNLERHLEVRLLHRTTRKLSLTSEGERYAARCREILALIEDTESSLHGPAKAPRGRLRVDLPGALARALLLPRLHLFLKRYPGIHLALGIDDRPLDLVEEGIDCVIRTGELRDSTLVARRVGSLEWITCAAPSYLARSGVPRDLDDLARHRCIHYFSHGSGRGTELLFERDGHAAAVPMAGDVSVNDTELYISLCLHGHGLIQVARVIVAEHLAAGRLVEVLPASRPPASPVSLVYPHRGYMSPAMRAFSDWAGELFGQPAPQPPSMA